MAETKNPESPIVAPRAARFGEGPEAKVTRVGSRKPSIFERFAQFVHDVRSEMKRVTWPTMKHVQQTTIITLIAVVFFAVYLFLVDQGLSRLILGLEWLVDKIARWLGLA